jgi:hypothetical protein
LSAASDGDLGFIANVLVKESGRSLANCLAITNIALGRIAKNCVCQRVFRDKCAFERRPATKSPQYCRRCAMHFARTKLVA